MRLPGWSGQGSETPRRKLGTGPGHSPLDAAQRSSLLPPDATASPLDVGGRVLFKMSWLAGLSVSHCVCSGCQLEHHRRLHAEPGFNGTWITHFRCSHAHHVTTKCTAWTASGNDRCAYLSFRMAVLHQNQVEDDTISS